MKRRLVRPWFDRIRRSYDRRPLTEKLVAIVISTGLIGAFALIVVLGSAIVPSFNALEVESIELETGRTNAALDTFANTLEQDAREYIGDAGGAPSEADAIRALQSRTVDGLAQVDHAGRTDVVRWQAADGDNLQDGFVIAIRGMPLDRIVGRHHSAHFYRKLGSDIAAFGVVRIAGGGAGGRRGYVIMARRLTASTLSDAARQPVRIDLRAGSDRPAVVATRQTLRIMVPIRSDEGRVLGSVAIGLRRNVMVLGQRVLLLAGGGAVLLLLVILLVLLRMVTTLVLRPLARVEHHMQIVRTSGALDLLVDVPREDEIGSLSTSFNAMLRQLHDLRQRLEIQNFALGKSESAIAMLHNVRNALTPVSTILSQGIAQPPPVDQIALDRAIGELALDELDPERRTKLAAFVAAASAAGANNRAERRAALQVARDAMGQVLEIIGQQQRAVHERPTLRPCDITEILARNATIARYAENVSIAFSFPAQRCVVLASRIILSQVIGNLFANAADAIAARGTGSGSITVTIERIADPGLDANGGTARISICDDGEGFALGDATDLFQRGYSTRRHKAGGFGLHWCANAMLAMQGTLRLDSAGRGKGAVATLMLPVVLENQVPLAH